MQVFGEFAPDVPPYNVETCEVAKNCLPAPVGYRPLPAGAVHNSDYHCGDETRDCSGFAVFGSVSQTDWIYALVTMGTTKLKCFINGNSHDVIQSGITLQANFGGLVTMIRWGQTLYFFGAISAPQKLADFSSTYAIGTTTDVGGSPPASAGAARVGKFIVLARVGGVAAFRLQWSAFDDPDSWTAGTDQSGFEDFDADQGFISGVFGGPDGVVFQENAVTRMTYVGLPNVWDFEVIATAPGMFGAGHGVAVGNDIYYLSQAGFYVLRNRIEPIPIGANRVDRWFRADAGFEDASSTRDITFAYMITCGYDPVAHQVWWAYPSADQTGVEVASGINNRVIIYDINLDKWSHADISVQKFASEPLRLVDNTTEKPFRQHGICWVDNDGTNNTVYQPTGTAMDATIETAALVGEKKRMVVDSVRPVIDGTCTVSVLTRDELPGDTEVETGPTSLDSDGKADFETEGRYQRFKFETSGAFEHAVGYIPSVTESGSR